MFLTQDFPPRFGGSQSYHWGLIQTLDPDEVVILAPGHADAAAFDATHPYRVIRTDRPVLLPTPGLLDLAKRIIVEHGAELLQLGHPLPNGVLGPRLARAAGLPYAVFLAGAEVTLPAALPVSGHAIRWVLRNAALLLTVSGFTAAAAVGIVGRKVPVGVLRPAIDVGSFAPVGDESVQGKRGLGVEGGLIVCVGRLVPRKGQDRLIDALALLTPRHPGLHLALIGGGRLGPALVRRAERQGVAERVHVLGPLPADQLSRWLSAADLFASPCRNRWGGLEVEGFGIVFAEAALMGLPVLAGRSGGAPEAVREGETGIVVNGASAREVAAGLDRLLSLGAEGRRQMGARGRSLALQRHTPAVVGRRYRDLLRVAAANRPAPGRVA